MKNAIRSVLMVLCGGVIASSALAEAAEYVLQTSDMAANSASWSADGGTTLVTPDEAPAGSVFRVKDGKAVAVCDYVMPGKLLLGDSDGGTSGSICAVNDKDFFLSADIDWFGGLILNNSKNARLTLKGKLNILTAQDHQFGGSSSNYASLESDLLSESSDVKLIIGHKFSSSATFAEINAACPAARMCLMGDNSGYKGKFGTSSASNSGRPLILGGTNPLGDPSTPNAQAFAVSKGSYVFALASGCVQNKNRGLYFSSDNVNYFGAWKDEFDGETLIYPISSQNGTKRGKFIKVGDGTFRINTTCSMQEIAVSNGTFVVGKDTVFSDSRSAAPWHFVVGVGARLVIEPGAKEQFVEGKITNLGGEVVYEYQPIVVPFDGTNSTPVTVTDTIGGGYVQPVVFSQPFDIPFSATNRVAALVIPNGNYTEADFRDDTPKAAYGLPTTWVELEKDEATGDQTVYVVAKPAIAMSKTGNWGGVGAWSDGLAAHAGSDYYFVDGFGCVSGDQRTSSGTHAGSITRFVGDTYTIADANMLRVYHNGIVFKGLRTYSGATINCNPGSTTTSLGCVVDGPWCVGGGLNDWDVPSVLNSSSYLARLELSSPLTGAGALKIDSTATKLNDADDRIAVSLTGDNSAFAGQLVFEEQSSTKSFVEVIATNGAAFGGALTRFADNAVTISKVSGTVSRQTERVVINPTASMTVDAANRGWKTTCGCGFRMPAGVTFTFAPPRFTVGGEILKDGAGTWAFACGELVAADAAKLTVAEGAISQLKEGCLSELPIVFAGGGICVDVNADAGAKEKGIVAKSFALAEGTDTIPVTFANLPDVRTASATEVHVAILTAPAGSPEFQFVAKAPKGYKVTLTSAPGEDGATVYSADLVPKGVLLIVR